MQEQVGVMVQQEKGWVGCRGWWQGRQQEWQRQGYGSHCCLCHLQAVQKCLRCLEWWQLLLQERVLCWWWRREAASEQPSCSAAVPKRAWRSQRLQGTA